MRSSSRLSEVLTAHADADPEFSDASASDSDSEQASPVRHAVPVPATAGSRTARFVPLHTSGAYQQQQQQQQQQQVPTLLPHGRNTSPTSGFSLATAPHSDSRIPSPSYQKQPPSRLSNYLSYNGTAASNNASSPSSESNSSRRSDSRTPQLVQQLSAQVFAASVAQAPRSQALQSQAAIMMMNARSSALPGMNPSLFSGNESAPISSEQSSSYDPIAALDGFALDLKFKFGFQEDVLANVKEMLATMIQSRASAIFETNTNPVSMAALHQQQIASGFIKRTYSAQSLSNYSAYISAPLFSSKVESERIENLPAGLLSLFNDYIYGKNSNYRRWCLSDPVRDVGISYEVALRAWRRKYKSYSIQEKTRQLLLYFAITQESSNTRLMPELMWFLFKTAVEHLETNQDYQAVPGEFLNFIVKPIYDFHSGQLYFKDVNGKFIRRERDHAQIIGYDDLNELFWDNQTIDEIVLKNGQKLSDLPTVDRWEGLKHINWEMSAKKTFYERRTFINHLFVNFSRIASFLLGTFFFYLLTLLTPVVWDHRFGPMSPYDSPYVISQRVPVPGSLRAAAFAIGGFVAVFVALVATFSERFYVPRTTRNLSILNTRLAVVGLLFLICAIPLAGYGYLFFGRSFDPTGSALVGLSVASAILNSLGFLIVSFVPPQDFSRRKIYNQEFVGRLSKMTKWQSGTSKSMWALLMIAKFVETYFIIFTPVIPAFESIFAMDTRTCMNQDLVNMCIVLRWFSFMLLTCLVMIFYFLDTYVWWLLMTSGLQYSLSTFKLFKLWAWEKVLPMLPNKLVPRLVSTAEMPPLGNFRTLNAYIWNTIMDNFKEDHLISEEQHERLCFTEVTEQVDEGSMFLKSDDKGLGSGKSITSSLMAGMNNTDTKSLHSLSVTMENRLGEFANRIYMDPDYLLNLSNGATKVKFFGSDSEAERRLKYLAHTMDMNFPSPVPVKKMPAFGVLIPHYSEKIILSFEELTNVPAGSSISLLTYLKNLHSDEWDNLMEECEALIPNEETQLNSSSTLGGNDDRSFVSIASLNAVDTNIPETIPVEVRLQVRLWASRRQQSLYRTVSGVFKYYEALELLYRIECADELGGLNEEERDRAVKMAIQNKFKLTISMQRYSEFSPEEKDNTKLLFDLFPSMIVAYPERVRQPDGTEKVFTRVIDGFCPLDEKNEFIPKLNIELPGWPILGDGKGCNQSHGIFFTRGEFLQVLDANQDHYFEECLKVRSLLSEFKAEEGDEPVGLVGLREHIFSAGVGAVADFSATTETTLVSLNQPTLHKLGARLHYGHPDFWNLSYALPRGGVSKAQKGLHVNEDIFAGMMVLMRGGQNRHCEYMQVGKGKDLGLNSVMGYFSKLAMGMSEQILSREQYRLGTSLPFDRLLTFYFANPGFITSNVFAMLSLQMFTLFFVCVSALANALTACPKYDVLGDGNFNATQVELNPPPFGCAILTPVYDWQTRIVLTFIPVIFVILIPVMLHTAFERGVLSVLRYLRQLASLSLVFSVFSTQVWARSFLNTATFGQARYISTGRSVEIARKSFQSLYGNYKELSLAIGLALTCGVLYSTASSGANTSLIFLWLSVPPLFLSPFLYNPHQFRFESYATDYCDTLSWFGKGSNRSHDQKADSWIAFHKRYRTQYTGTKTDPENAKKGLFKETRRRAWRSVIWMHEILFPVIISLIAFTIYAVGTSGGIRLGTCLVLISAIPVISNGVMLITVFALTLLLGPITSLAAKENGVAPVTANFMRVWSLLNLLVVMVGCWILSDFVFNRALLGFICFCMIQRLYIRILTLCLPREIETNNSNLAWWDGRWNRMEGYRPFFAFIREYFCKVIEMTSFAMDVFQSHVLLLILFPFTWVKYIDDIHSGLVLWIPLSMKEKNLSREARKAKQMKIVKGLSCLGLFVVLIVILVIPAWWVPSAIHTQQMNVKHDIWGTKLGRTSCSLSIECPSGQQCVFATYPQVWSRDYGVCYPIPTAIKYQTCGGNVADPAVCEDQLSCFFPTTGTNDDSGYCFPRTNGGVGDTCITSNSTDYFNSIGSNSDCQSGLSCAASPDFPFVHPGYLGTCE